MYYFPIGFLSTSLPDSTVRSGCELRSGDCWLLPARNSTKNENKWTTQTPCAVKRGNRDINNGGSQCECIFGNYFSNTKVHWIVCNKNRQTTSETKEIANERTRAESLHCLRFYSTSLTGKINADEMFWLLNVVVLLLEHFKSRTKTLNSIILSMHHSHISTCALRHTTKLWNHCKIEIFLRKLNASNVIDRTHSSFGCITMVRSSIIIIRSPTMNIARLIFHSFFSAAVLAECKCDPHRNTQLSVSNWRSPTFGHIRCRQQRPANLSIRSTFHAIIKIWRQITFHSAVEQHLTHLCHKLKEYESA